MHFLFLLQCGRNPLQTGGVMAILTAIHGSTKCSLELLDLSVSILKMALTTLQGTVYNVYTRLHMHGYMHKY